ncbi:MAG: c-type cytochrome [Cellvibrio sp.]
MKAYIIFVVLMVCGTNHVSASEALAKANGCFECHELDKKVVGPSFNDIAAKYKNDNLAREALVEKIKKGSKGNWSEISNGVPMPPYSPRMTDPDIKLVVDWILLL